MHQHAYRYLCDIWLFMWIKLSPAVIWLKLPIRRKTLIDQSITKRSLFFCFTSDGLWIFQDVWGTRGVHSSKGEGYGSGSNRHGVSRPGDHQKNHFGKRQWLHHSSFWRTRLCMSSLMNDATPVHCDIVSLMYNVVSSNSFNYTLWLRIKLYCSKSHWNMCNTLKRIYVHLTFTINTCNRLW